MLTHQFPNLYNALKGKCATKKTLSLNALHTGKYVLVNLVLCVHLMETSGLHRTERLGPGYSYQRLRCQKQLQEQATVLFHISYVQQN